MEGLEQQLPKPGLIIDNNESLDEMMERLRYLPPGSAGYNKLNDEIKNYLASEQAKETDEIEEYRA